MREEDSYRAEMLMTPTLSADLELVIRRYIDSHRSRSLATLSRASGVAYSTLRRFATREGNPTAEPVLKILDATLGTKEKVAFVERHFPEIARSITRYAQCADADTEPLREDLKAFYRRSPHNLILNLAISVAGTSVDIVRRLCGERGVDALDELVECQLLEHNTHTGRVRYKDDTLLTVDCDFLLDQLRFSTEYFDRSLIGTTAARHAHLTASINREGLERIHALMTRMLQEIAAINEDPRYAGRIPYFAGALMNVYDKRALKDEEDA